MKNVLLQWATGLGKTKAALDYVKSYYKKTKHIPSILVVIAEVAHKENWIKEVTKWRCKTAMSKAAFICYASLNKYENTKWDFIIMDECHHLFSEKRCKSFRTLQYNNIICLSATLTNDNIAMLQSDIKDLQLDVRTLKDCINEGNLVEPEINTVDYTLSKAETIKYGSICRKYEWAANNNFNNAKKMTAIKRKNYIASLKTNSLKTIVEKLRKEGTRFACYCASIQQMIEVSGNVNCVSSKHLNHLKTIDKFNSGEISEIFFCQMGTEGLNLFNIEVGVICQADANTRPFIQKVGRVLRNKINPKIYIIKAVNTIDEQWINGCLKTI